MQSLIYSFFSWYISQIIKKDFHDFSWNEISVERNRFILLLANHFSWFLIFHLNRAYFKKKFNVMVAEENYKTVFFLKYLGAFSINKKSRSLIQSLEHEGKLLTDKNKLVLIFPQGKLYSNQNRGG